MKYNVKHRTSYRYSEAVTLCQNHARLTPLSGPRQRCLQQSLEIAPGVDYRANFTDYFGNVVTCFDIHRQHSVLEVVSMSMVEVLSPPELDIFALAQTWEEVRDMLTLADTPDLLRAVDFVAPTPLTAIDDAVREYALQSFTPKRPMYQACSDLMSRIYRDFTYQPGFTNISTPVAEVLDHRKGVCQDFAHLALACLRSLGLAARYVSGYIETVPPEGEAKLEGADATHAWFAAYLPRYGWMDFDPTNDLQPDIQHITLATGRDFADVSPLKGIIIGGGHHQLSVAVDMNRIDE